MWEESTTAASPELLELVSGWVKAWNRRDVDGVLALLAPDAAWDAMGVGYERLRGRPAIRSFIEAWLSPYDEFELKPEVVRDLGGGLAFLVLDTRGRLAGSDGTVHLRFAFVGTYRSDRILSITGYTDIDEARAAAERLAAERE
jgi:uncharacterized protein (TIGR02246 family)